MMSRMLSVLALSFAVLASGACADKYLNEASSTQARGTAFDNALARDYLAMAKSENVQSDYKDTETFARRSQAAAQGKPTLPDEPGLRKTWLGTVERQVSCRRRGSASSPSWTATIAQRVRK